MKKNIQVSWKSPSNIAFIKYWGKHGVQLPMNPSLSMTLDKCYTETHVSLIEKKASDKLDLEFLFEGKKNKNFENRIAKFITDNRQLLSFINDYKLKIESSNSFPHSAGIASSASAMSALALCLATIEQRIGKNKITDLYQWASNLARLGSGSASRSVYGEYTIWGKNEFIATTSDEYAVPLKTLIHKDFLCLRDVVLLIDSGQKKVSSSVGHSLMNKHPYAAQRFANAKENLDEILKSMKKGDFNRFAYLIEHEALSLHAMMMTAEPWFTLLSPNTLVAIERIKLFREETNTKICFTLDAGPNIHLLFPAEEDKKVKSFIETELSPLCVEGKYILDNIGNGPELLKDEFN